MSDTPPNRPPKLDPRARRTRDKLGDALVALVQERAFESITVQDVLDRAGVARSTFYAHYQDKDDLFQSDADDFFQHFARAPIAPGPDGPRVAPVRELLEHVASARGFFDAVVAAGKHHDLLELGRGHFARAIAERFASEPRAANLGEVEREELGHALAGALFALLLAWMRDPARRPAAEVDARFHALVWAGVGGRAS